MTSLDESYAVCARAARRAASNFYYTFFLLPGEQRRAMCAVYAYLRELDDIGDGPLVTTPSALPDFATQARLELLEAARSEFVAALAGTPRGPILPAVIDTIRRFAIPAEYFTAVMDGVAMDLLGRRYATWDELSEYCYRVASVVGLICLHIWRFRDEAAFAPARDCGLAFQLTNILRDLGEDARRGRVYLPDDDLRQCGYPREELLEGRVNAGFQRLLDLETDRARRLYESAAVLPRYLNRSGARMCTAMHATYRALLDEVHAHGAELFSRRIRVTRWRKLRIAARAILFGAAHDTGSNKAIPAPKRRPTSAVGL